MSHKLTLILAFGLMVLHGSLSRADAMGPYGTKGAGGTAPSTEVQFLPTGRSEPDTTWYGGIDSSGHAVPDGTWDFSNGTLQGWSSLDLTDNTGVYFARVVAADLRATLGKR